MRAVAGALRTLRLRPRTGRRPCAAGPGPATGVLAALAVSVRVAAPFGPASPPPARAQDRVAAAAPARRAHAASRPSPIERWVERAEDRVRRGRMADALALFERAVAAAPGDRRTVDRALALFSPPLGLSVTRLTADEAALARRVRALVEVHLAAPGSNVLPEDRRSLSRRLAWIDLLVGAAPEDVAARAAASCGLVDDEGATLLRAVAAVAVRDGDLATAQTALEAAVRCAAHDAAPVAELGAVLLARGRADAAVDAFREVVRRRPDDSEATRDLAGALLAAGRAREALALFSARAQERGDDADAQLDLARAALEAGEPARAADAAARAAALAPTDAEAALVQAAAALAVGDRGAAARAFREALRRRPGDVRATEGLRALAGPGGT